MNVCRALQGHADYVAFEVPRRSEEQRETWIQLANLLYEIENIYLERPKHPARNVKRIFNLSALQMTAIKRG